MCLLNSSEMPCRQLFPRRYPVFSPVALIKLRSSQYIDLRSRFRQALIDFMESFAVTASNMTACTNLIDTVDLVHEFDGTVIGHEFGSAHPCEVAWPGSATAGIEANRKESHN